MLPDTSQSAQTTSHLIIRKSRARALNRNSLLLNAINYCASAGLPAPALWQINDSDWNEPFIDQLRTGKAPELPAGHTVVIVEMEHMFSACYDAIDCIEHLRKRGVALHVIGLGVELTASNASVSAETLLAAMSRIEGQRSRQRVRRVKQEQRTQGRYLGGNRPFGYTVHENGRLIENPMEQRIIRRIKSLHANGRSLRAIAREVSTPLTPISFKTVQRVLSRHV